MPSRLLPLLTDFADQAVVLPVVAVVALMLAGLGWRRGAIGWVAGLGATLAAVLALKLLLLACGGPGLRSPSGHTAAAAACCGGLWWLCARPARLYGAAALLGALGIGATRLGLGVHTPGEVAVGAAVGVAGAALVRRLAGARPARVRAAPVLLAAGLAAAALHGRHLAAEAAIRGSAWAQVCPIR